MPISSKNLITDCYFDVLKTLNSKTKLELISKLSQSLKDISTTSGTSIQSLFGAYKSEETAEEIIASIKLKTQTV